MSTNLTPMPWENWLGDHQNPSAQRAVPRDLDELRQCVQHAVDNNLKIKGLGSGHSHSAVSRPDNIGIGLNLLETDPNTNRHRVLSDLGILKANPPGIAANETLVRVSAGVRIKELNRSLLAPIGLALPNMGSYDGQSIAGAINTGTHGTGIGISTIADMVASVEIVTALRECHQPVVKHIRIEPTNGITDPVKFRLQYPDRGAVHLLIQDDRIFYSSVLSFGTMGIAYAYTLKAVPAFWLRESLRMEFWNDLSADLLNTTPVTNVGDVPIEVDTTEHFLYLVIGAMVQDQDDFTTTNPKVQVKSMTRVTPDTMPSNWSLTWPPERNPDAAIPAIINPNIHPTTKNPCIGTTIKNRLANQVNRTGGWKTPFVKGFEQSASFIALRRWPDPAPTAFGPMPVGPPPATSLEIAVPVGFGVAAVSDILDFMAANTNFRFNIPIAVRYVAPSKHYMSQAYGRGCCLIEVASILEFQTATVPLSVLDNLIKPKLAELENEICYNSPYGGLPHLGKQNAMTRQQAEQFIPEWEAWLEVYEAFNSFGLFDNHFTDRLGLSNVASTVTLECDNVTAVVDTNLVNEWFGTKTGDITKGPIDPTIKK